MDYDEINDLPDAFFNIKAKDISRLFPRPTLIHIPGGSADAKPIFLSTLLHGNEHTSLYAAQAILHRYLKTDGGLPRPLTLLVGNPRAANQNLRMLAGQADMNRIWTYENAQKKRHLVKRVLELIKQKDYAVCCDIHNNTGKNPLYSCISRLDQHHKNLAGLFSPTCVYLKEPSSALTVFLSQHLPTIAVEAGLSGSKLGLERSVELINALLRLDHDPLRLTKRLSIFQTIARLRINSQVSFSFDHEVSSQKLSQRNHDIIFRHDMDLFNFSSHEGPTFIGKIIGQRPLNELILLDQIQQPLWDSSLIFEKNGNIYIRPDLVPSMFTLDRSVIQQDCLGYLMEPIK